MIKHVDFSMSNSKESLNMDTKPQLDSNHANVFEVLEKYPDFELETQYVIQRIQKSIYLPVDMIMNIALSKAINRQRFANMNWWLELKYSVINIIEFRKWAQLKACPF